MITHSTKNIIAAVNLSAFVYDNPKRDGYIEPYKYVDVYSRCKINNDEVMIGVKNSKRTLYIVYTGTNETIDWVRNFLPFQRGVLYNKKDSPIRGHYGFYKGHLSLWRYVKKYLPMYNKIVVCGHSRGGPIATVAARHIRHYAKHFLKTPKEICLYTFGSPVFYNYEGAEEFNESGIKSLRYVYYNDIVPAVPPEWMGYKHVNKLVQIGGRLTGLNPLDHYPRNYINSIETMYKGIDNEIIK